MTPEWVQGTGVLSGNHDRNEDVFHLLYVLHVLVPVGNAKQFTFTFIDRLSKLHTEDYLAVSTIAR